MGGRRVPASRQTGEQIDELLTGGDDGDVRTESEHRMLCLFVDGVAERLRPGLAREAVLCAWGIDEEGKKVLLALSPGTKEDTELPGVLPGHAPARAG